MKKSFLLLLSFIIAFGMLIPNERTFADEPALFPDAKGHWAESVIQEAVRRGIISGFPDGMFRPDDIVTADQLLVMLFRAYSKTYLTPKGDQVRWDQDFLQHLNEEYPGRLGSLQNALAEQPFYFQIDEKGYWAQPYVDFAYKMGYLASYDPVFPKDYKLFQKPINREQASYLLGSWYKGYVNTFDRTYENFAINTGVVKDLNDFSWTNVSGYVATMLLSGVMRGYPNGYFYPKRFVTRAEAVSMILRVREPELRVPFKPDLTHVCYSQTNEHDIHIFDDRVKCEAYKKIVDLGKSTVQDGYADIGTLGVSIFASKEEADKNTRYTQLGLFDEIPRGEIGLTVGDDGEHYIELVYNAETPLTYSKPLFDAAIQFLVGKGNEQSMLDALKKLEQEPVSQTAISIIIGGRTFKMFRTQHSFVIDYFY